MDLYKELLIKVLAEQKIHIAVPDLHVNANEIVELQSFQMLQKIKAIINNDSLSDFARIEKIVRLFKQIGADDGNKQAF